MKKPLFFPLFLLCMAQIQAQLKNNFKQTVTAVITSPKMATLIFKEESRAAMLHDKISFTSTKNYVPYFKDEPAKKKKHYILKGILIGGAIGFAPIIFGEGGAYAAMITFPAGIITGAILGIRANKKYNNR
jgi:hypothetical protein